MRRMDAYHQGRASTRYLGSAPSGASMGQPSVASGRDEADHQRSMTDPDESGRAQGIERSLGRVRSAVVMARLRARGR